MSGDCCLAFPRDAIGLSAVCDCGISWSYSLTIFDITPEWLRVVYISYLSYELNSRTFPDKHCLSHGMCIYQDMVTFFFF